MAASLSPRLFSKLDTPALIKAREWVESVLDFRGRQATLFAAVAPLSAATVEVATAAPSPATPDLSIPEVLSPSAVSCFMECSAKWFYRRVLQLPETRGSALVIGSAVHEALTTNFRQKIETGEDLPTAGVQAVCRDSFERQLDEGATLAEGEDPYELAELADGLVSCVMADAAPMIQPAAVELPVEGLVGDVPVRGYVDLLDVDGNIVDFKTASKKPEGVRDSHRLQVATYALVTPQASGRAAVHTVTKTKTIRHYVDSIAVSDADVKYTERMYSIVRDQMASGLVAPNRSSHLCSRQYCSFADRCTADYGGEVD
jgi:CRISPR/Cas system-associated exonuclease Cas4 (RecB family)